MVAGAGSLRSWHRSAVPGVGTSTRNQYPASLVNTQACFAAQYASMQGLACPALHSLQCELAISLDVRAEQDRERNGTAICSDRDFSWRANAWVPANMGRPALPRAFCPEQQACARSAVTLIAMLTQVA